MGAARLHRHGISRLDVPRRSSYRRAATHEETTNMTAIAATSFAVEALPQEVAVGRLLDRPDVEHVNVRNTQAAAYRSGIRSAKNSTRREAAGGSRLLRPTTTYPVCGNTRSSPFIPGAPPPCP
jgi:hypothetical protein